VELKKGQRLLLRVAHSGKEALELRLEHRGVLALRERQELKRKLLNRVEAEQVHLRLAKLLAKLHAKSEKAILLPPPDLDPAKVKKAVDAVMGKELLLEMEVPGELAHLVELLWLTGSLTSSIVGFLPLEWEGLEENAIIIKRLRGQRVYYCRIKLRFADIRRLDFSILLHKRFLQLHFFVEDHKFRESIEENLSLLRQKLSAKKVAVSLLVSDYNDDSKILALKDRFVDRYA